MIDKSNYKKKYEDLKARAIKTFEEHPLETIAVASMAAAATAKLIKSISEARNASTWRREVRRREDKQYRTTHIR